MTPSLDARVVWSNRKASIAVVDRPSTGQCAYIEVSSECIVWNLPLFTRQHALRLDESYTPKALTPSLRTDTGDPPRPLASLDAARWAIGACYGVGK